MHVRRTVVDEAFDGTACGWCQNVLKLGEEAVICTACEQVHHGRCWEARAGCPTAGCAHAPLRRIDADAPGPVAKTNAPGAVSSLVFGVLGFLTLWLGLLGLLLVVIFGLASIQQARSARKAMASDPTLSKNWATGGLVLGAIDVTLGTLRIVAVLVLAFTSR